MKKLLTATFVALLVGGCGEKEVADNKTTKQDSLDKSSETKQELIAKEKSRIAIGKRTKLLNQNNPKPLIQKTILKKIKRM